MIRRILDGVRRRNRLRVATIALYNEGMCRHVHARVVAPDTYDGLAEVARLRVEYVHACGENCAWLAARRIVDEQIGAW